MLASKELSHWPMLTRSYNGSWWFFRFAMTAVHLCLACLCPAKLISRQCGPHFMRYPWSFSFLPQGRVRCSISGLPMLIFLCHCCLLHQGQLHNLRKQNAGGFCLYVCGVLVANYFSKTLLSPHPPDLCAGCIISIIFSFIWSLWNFLVWLVS